MTIFLESPWPALVIGIFAEAILAIILLRTGRGVLLWAMIGVGLLVAGAVVLERLVVTEREEVEAAIDAMAAALGANDQKTVESWIAKDAKEVRALVQYGFQHAKFTQAKITHLEIIVNYHTSPPTAQAKLSGSVYFRANEYPYEGYPVNDLTLDLEQQSGRWLITGYRWSEDPRGGKN
jgi:hypothetical protein